METLAAILTLAGSIIDLITALVASEAETRKRPESDDKER